MRNAAITLAESGNLLMMVPRAKDGGEWMKMAQQMIDTSEAAIKAAEAKNPERLFTVGGDIYESCSACHRKIHGGHCQCEQMRVTCVTASSWPSGS